MFACKYCAFLWIKIHVEQQSQKAGALKFWPKLLPSSHTDNPDNIPSLRIRQTLVFPFLVFLVLGYTTLIWEKNLPDGNVFTVEFTKCRKNEETEIYKINNTSIYSQKQFYQSAYTHEMPIWWRF